MREEWAMRGFRAGGLAAVLALVAACSSGPSGTGVREDTRPGDPFIGGKLKVTAVDTSQLGAGTAVVTVDNVSGEALHLEYALAVYYPTNSTSKPFDVERSGWGLLSLRPRQSEVLRWKAPRPGGHHLKLHVRAASTKETSENDQFLDGRVVVTEVAKDEFARPARYRFVVKSNATTSLRVRYSVRFEREGKLIHESAWKSVKLDPGASTTLEATSEGMTDNAQTSAEILQIVLVGT